MFAAMLFAFFFFLGFLAMFIYSERKRDRLIRSLSDEHAQLRVLLRALESRMDQEQSGSSGAGNAQPEANQAANQEYDPLLHLSFEEPGILRNDPSLELTSLPEENDTKRQN